MARLAVQTQDLSGICILTVSGDLDTHTAPQFESTLQDLLHRKQVRIVISLEELLYISSAGLNVLARYIDQARSHGGDIKIARTSERIYRIFDLLGYPHLYEFYDEIEPALDRFADTSGDPDPV